MTDRADKLSASVPNAPLASRSPAWLRRLIGFLVFAVVFGAHVLSYVRTPADSVLTIPRAMSILAHGDTNLDEYHSLPWWSAVHYMRETVDGHDYCMYPIGPVLVAVPFVIVESTWHQAAHGERYEDHLKTRVASGLEEFVASLCTAAAALFVYLAVCRRTGRVWPALLVVLALAFGTTAWSVASRALWQHGPSMMFLSLAVYLLVVAETRAAVVQFVSLPLAAAYVCRPTSAIPVLVLSAFVLWKYRRWFVPYLLWSLVVAGPFVWFNLSIYGKMLSPYYTPHALLIRSPFWTALAGHLVSPARGLLIFSPVLVLAFVGVGIKLKERRLDALDLAFGVIFLAHWAAISMMGWAWWGGHGFGPRFFTDVLPFACWFLVPVAEKFARPVTFGRASLAATFFLLAAASVAINFRGANHPSVWDWNVIPVNVDTHTERLWDWHDLQFLRTKPAPASAPASPGTP